jgi:hypothetical protein
MNVSKLLLLPGIIGLIFVCDCAGHTIAQQPSLDEMRSMQIIIKFRNEGFDPSAALFVQELSRDAQAQITYLRPMSSGAYVFRVEKISAAARLDEIVQRLAKRTDILYIEPDRIMHHQPAKQ